MRIKTLFLIAVLCVLSISAAPQMIPPPAGVTELKFGELLESPVGDRGLRLSEKSKSLEGKRVRLLGHMVQQDNPIPGMFLLSAIPVQLHDEHYGLADDLPATTVFVSTPSEPNAIVQYRPGLLLVTGVLSVGNREELDGRVSTFRIALECPETVRKYPASQSTKTTRSSGKGAIDLLKNLKRP
jgi:hypothetical protein